MGTVMPKHSSKSTVTYACMGKGKTLEWIHALPKSSPPTHQAKKHICNQQLLDLKHSLKNDSAWTHTIERDSTI